jgi:thiamine biosynthesis lipoprotein
VLTVLGPEEGFDFAQRHEIAALFVSHGDTAAVERITRAWPTPAGA